MNTYNLEIRGRDTTAGDCACSPTPESKDGKHDNTVGNRSPKIKWMKCEKATNVLQ